MPQKYEFAKAQLNDVLRFLAEDAGISYFGLPEGQDGMAKQTLVTFSMVASPFSTLETVANTHGVALIYDQGTWFMRPLDDKSLIARNYQIKYNSQESVTSVGSGFGPASKSQMSGGAGGGGGGGAASGGASGGGASGGGASGGNISLDGGDVPHIAANADELTDAIKDLLGIPTNGFDAMITRETNVDLFGRDPMATPQRMYTTPGENGSKQAESKPVVLWNSDNNYLFVVATRAQHQMIEEYLSKVDRPQPMIAVETKFFESTKDPRKEMGVDWSGTLSDINVGLSQDGSTGGGFQTPPFDLNKSLSNILLPQTAILSATDVSARIRFLLNDSETTNVSYPRVVTLNNREVVIRNVVNQPVLASSSATSPGLGATTTQTVQYLPIGTTINLLPKRQGDGTVKLTLSIVVSTITGYEPIGGARYPKASSRMYTAPLQVKSGYTVAIAGLDEASDSRDSVGVPLLSSIPLVGNLFKDLRRERHKKNLMIWITPTVLEPETDGLGDKLISELPNKHSDPVRQSPRIYSDGSLEGGPAKLGDAILWADREQRLIERIILEARNTNDTKGEVFRLRKVCKTLLDYITRLKLQDPGHAESYEMHEMKLRDVQSRAMKLYCKDWQNSFSDFLGR